MSAEDIELKGWDVEGPTLVEPGPPADLPSASVSSPNTLNARKRRSLRDIAPLRCGPVLSTFDRAELADEMFDR